MGPTTSPTVRPTSLPPGQTLSPTSLPSFNVDACRTDAYDCVAACALLDSALTLRTHDILACAPASSDNPRRYLIFALDFNSPPEGLAERVLRGLANASMQPSNRFGIVGVEEGSIIASVVVMHFEGEPLSVPAEVAEYIDKLVGSLDPTLIQQDEIFELLETSSTSAQVAQGLPAAPIESVHVAAAGVIVLAIAVAGLLLCMSWSRRRWSNLPRRRL